VVEPGFGADAADLLYFTITVFSTVGFDDITAKTQAARSWSPGR
jgi:hypothetical protein